MIFAFFKTKFSFYRNLFGHHGQLGRVVLPPSHTIALIEFLESSDAKKAFRSLAYRKFKMEPLYLEVVHFFFPLSFLTSLQQWAPMGVFKAAAPKDIAAEAPVVEAKQAVQAVIGSSIWFSGRGKILFLTIQNKSRKKM